MPDHNYFRSEKVQKQMLDILFVYCKLNEDLGYRQGMHELVAPILWVVDHDSVQADFSEVSEEDKYMLEVFDPAFVEHDTFSLLQVVMHSARPWYELGEDSDPSGRGNNSPIVEKSRVIHEELLMAVDPELARHLRELEILPQVFLMYEFLCALYYRDNQTNDDIKSMDTASVWKVLVIHDVSPMDNLAHLPLI